VIAAPEYAIANFAATAELRATSAELTFNPPPAWYDLETSAAHGAMASRVLLRAEMPPAMFVSNVVVQYFTLGDIEPVRLSVLDTSLDITALPHATVIGHTVDRDGYFCTDDGVYTAQDTELRVRRAQLAYRTPTGQSALTIFTATTTVSAAETVQSEIREMEDQWLTTTINGDS